MFAATQLALVFLAFGQIAPGNRKVFDLSIKPLVRLQNQSNLEAASRRRDQDCLGSPGTAVRIRRGGVLTQIFSGCRTEVCSERTIWLFRSFEHPAANRVEEVNGKSFRIDQRDEIRRGLENAIKLRFDLHRVAPD